MIMIIILTWKGGSETRKFSSEQTPPHGKNLKIFEKTNYKIFENTNLKIFENTNLNLKILKRKYLKNTIPTSKFEKTT